MLSHGSDLALAPTVGPLVRQGLSVRSAIERLADAGFTAVQLDATLEGIRPRELDRRARQDLVALLRRRDLVLAGWDLFIPRRHYLEAQHMDRAIAATLAAIELAADTGRTPLSLTLPIDKLDAAALSSLIDAADLRRVRLAVHGEDRLEAMDAWLGSTDTAAAGVGVDAAAALLLKHDPAALVHRWSRRLASARLGDAAGDGERRPVGEGELDVADFRVAVDLAAARTGPVVLDLRGLAQPLTAAATAAQQWNDAGWQV